MAGNVRSVCKIDVCVLAVQWWVGEGEGDALTFNDALCNSTLEVIITNTMQVVTFDPSRRPLAKESR